MSLIDTLTAVECEKLREERYNAQHPANYVFCEEELMWVDPAASGTPSPVEVPVEVPAAATVEEVVAEPSEETPTTQAE